MENESFFTKVLIILYGVDVIAFSALSTIIYVYTIYYYFVHNGFWAGFISFITPGLSSVVLFFQLLPKEGIFGTLSLLILAFIGTGLIIAIPKFIEK